LHTRIDGPIQWTGFEKPGDICRRLRQPQAIPATGVYISSNPYVTVQGHVTEQLSTPAGRSGGADHRAR
jgi:hypothetical protein